MQQNLSQLKPYEKARIIAHHSRGAVRQRLIDLGLIPGQLVTLIRAAPLGDPLQIRIGQNDVAIRSTEAGTIQIESIALTDKPGR